MKKMFASPFTVMAIVLVMYIAKVAAKLSVGAYANSPMITGDGWHNVADIFEACVVIGVIAFARMPPSEDYPFGRKNIESVVSVLIGATLFFIGLKFLAGSVIDLAAFFGAPLPAFVPVREPLLMGPQYFPWTFGVTGVSFLLSLGVSAYQVRIGRANNNEALVADGEETRSDGMIEFTACAGVVAEYLFGAPWIEYLLAGIVALLIMRTAREIFTRGLHVLLQRSLDREHVEVVLNVLRSTRGIASHEDVRVFKAGGEVVCIVKIRTRNPRADAAIKDAVTFNIRKAFEGVEGLEAWRFFIRFVRPREEATRVAFAVFEGDGVIVMAPCITAANKVLIADREGGFIRRCTVEPMPQAKSEFIALLERKRVSCLFAMGEAEGALIGSIPINSAPAHSLKAMGF